MDKLGIEPKLLLAQIVNFSIIVFILAKFLYKPILNVIEKRKKEIEEGLKLTQKMREEDEKFQQKKQKMLETTRKEAQQIIEEARKQGKDEEKEIVEAAHKEAEQIIQKGKADIQSARIKMEKDVRQSSIELAALMSKRLLSKILSADEQHKLIAKHIKELESIKTA
jgi:F-type H+-transporting ATPase subunit b